MVTWLCANCYKISEVLTTGELLVCLLMFFLLSSTILFLAKQGLLIFNSEIAGGVFEYF